MSNHSNHHNAVGTQNAARGYNDTPDDTDRYDVPNLPQASRDHKGVTMGCDGLVWG